MTVPAPTPNSSSSSSAPSQEKRCLSPSAATKNGRRVYGGTGHRRAAAGGRRVSGTSEEYWQEWLKDEIRQGHFLDDANFDDGQFAVTSSLEEDEFVFLEEPMPRKTTQKNSPKIAAKIRQCPYFKHAGCRCKGAPKPQPEIAQQCVNRRNIDNTAANGMKNQHRNGRPGFKLGQILWDSEYQLYAKVVVGALADEKDPAGKSRVGVDYWHDARVRGWNDELRRLPCFGGKAKLEKGVVARAPGVLETC